MRAIVPVVVALITACSSPAPPDPELLSDSVSLPQDTPDAAGLATERFARLDAFLADLSERGDLGGSVAVIHLKGHEVYSKAFGWADVSSQVPMQTDTIVRIFSMTKPITCAAALILVDEGRLLLTDPVGRYLPQFADMKVVTSEQGGMIHTENAERPITIRMLANHTSGIAYLPSSEHYPLLFQRFETANLFDPQQTLEHMVDNLAKLPLIHQPGTTWEYSASIDVLARVVEVVSGQPFGEFLRERVFEPLSMNDTGFTVPEEDWARVSTVYTRTDADQLVEAPETGVLVKDDFKNRRHQAGGHGLMSTAVDYARFAQMLLYGGTVDGSRILSPAAAELMRKDTLQTVQSFIGSSTIPTFNEEALGFGLCGSVIKDPAQHTAYGSIGTYSWSGYATTHFFVDYEEDLAATLMSQYDPINPDQLFQRFANLVYQGIANN